MAKKSVIEFSNDTPDHLFLLNEFSAPFIKGERMWQNAMQYIAYSMLNPKGMDKKQATNNRALRDKIIGAFDPLKCRYFMTKKGLESNNAQLRDDVDEAFDKVLRQALDAKFKQNPLLLHLLLKTDGNKLVYANQYDDVLGAGRDGKGANKLGKALEKLRDKVIADNPKIAGTTLVFDYCASESAELFGDN